MTMERSYLIRKLARFFFFMLSAIFASLVKSMLILMLGGKFLLISF